MVFPFGSPACRGVGKGCCRREYPLGYPKDKELGCGVPLFAGFVTFCSPKRAVRRGAVPAPHVLQSLMSENGPKAALNSAKGAKGGRGLGAAAEGLGAGPGD